MYILADIGGTKIRVAGSVDLESFGEPVILDTPKEYDDALTVLTSAMTQIAGPLPITKVAIGIRGNISRARDSMIDTGPLHSWSGRSLSSDLKKALNCESVILENDSAMVGLGEAIFGAGKNAPIVVYMTVSTGIGGVRIVDGNIDRFHQGFEPGGQYLSMTPQLTLEDIASGEAVSKRFGMHPKEIGKDNPVWEELAEKFAYGLHNTILHWSPERIVLGGSMLNEIGIPVERIAHHVQLLMKKFPKIPNIVHSSLGDLGGLWGALAVHRKTDQRP